MVVEVVMMIIVLGLIIVTVEVSVIMINVSSEQYLRLDSTYDGCG